MLYLTLTLIAWVSIFGAAAIFLTDFASGAATVVGVILGALTTALSTLAGFAYARKQLDGDEEHN
jgi:Na+/proline symporter